MPRPSLYRPEYAAQMIEFGNRGLSRYQAAKEFGVSRQTLSNWCEQYEDFKEADAIYETNALAWWEDEGLRGMKDKLFYGHIWNKFISSRFRDQYTERKETAITGSVEVTTKEQRDAAVAAAARADS